MTTTTAAVGSIAGRTTSFLPTHREDNNSPVVFEATVTLPVSFDDLTAALWTSTIGMPLDEVSTDPADQYSVYGLVLEALVCNNVGVTDALAQIDGIRPGTDEYTDLCQVRALIAATFSLPAAPVPAITGARRVAVAGAR